MPRADLVALVADSNMKAAMEGIIARKAALQIPLLTARILVHPNRDSGCRLHGHELLRALQREYRYALLMFDADGCGVSGVPRTHLEQQAENALAASGWRDRSACVVIEPELDVWVWSDSPWVGRILGWNDQTSQLRGWLESEGFVFDAAGKPNQPKEAMEKVLRICRKPRSSSLYRQLADKVSLERCVDPSFEKLKSQLRNWFGPTGSAE